MKKYEAYKEAEGFWVKEVPKDWTYGSLNLLVDFVMGQAPHSSSYNQDGIGEIFIKTGDFGKIRPTAKWYTTKPLVFGKNEDVFICVVGATAGKVNLGLNGTISRSIAALRPRDKVNQRYLFYFLSYNYLRLNDSSQGSAQGIINKDILSSIKLPIPSIKEQTQIAKYLDHKTQIIDALIEKKEQLIKKLQAQRQAIINEAVTKGLNKNAKLKDSGIEWLGEIPESWDMVKLTWLTEFITCGLAATPKYVEDNVGVPFLSAQNVKPGRIKLHKYRFISNELHKKLTKTRKPQKDDLLVTRVGAGIGEAAVVDIDFEFSVYVSLTHIRTNQKLLSTFLMYFFSTEYAKNLALEGTVEGGGQGNLNVKNVENYRIALPTIKEQDDIIKFLNDISKKIDETIKQSQESITKLKSYRQSIISEAVTGKIDVRDWQAPKK